MFGKGYAKVFIFIIAFVFLLGSAFAARAGFVWFTLWYSAGPNGAVFGASPQMVAPGGDGTQVVAIPLIGYQFVNWSDGRTDNPRTDRNVFADVNVIANFGPIRRWLTYTAETGGTIVGDTPQRVPWGDDGTPVTAVANSGYKFIDWSDGVTTATRQELNVTNDLTVSARFQKLGMPVIYLPGGKGVGAIDKTIPMYGEEFIGVVDAAGINVLSYLGGQGNFDINLGGKTERHYLKISSVDMVKQLVSVEFASLPQKFDLTMDQTVLVDLNQDGQADLSAKFEDLYINRVELTILAVAGGAPASLPASVVEAATATVSDEETKYVFTRDLEQGMTGIDVKELQKFLNNHGFTVAIVGVGSLGNETETFGALTKQALVRFQLAKSISPAAGYFGPITRGIINSLNK